MKKIIILIGCLLIFTVGTLAQETPTFGEHAVKVEKIKSPTVNLASNKRARTFRTNLKNASKEKINFAGHYILTNWGCGTNCSMSGIIDARNGNVYFPRELEGYGYALQEWEGTDEPLEFKASSKLLILRGYTGGELNKDKPSGGIHYFIWNGSTLKRIKFIPKNDTP